jgi:hypothetical protein
MVTSIKFTPIALIAALGVLILAPASVMGSSLCVVPDNGTGTITLPPMGCEYTSPYEDFEIIDGLPPGTTIELDGTLRDFICCDGPPSCSACSLNLVSAECETTGGTLGGNVHCYEATLDLTASGTGSLVGFNRQLAVSVFGEVHTAPRTPGDPVQTFQTDIIRLQGELFGDPDFCVFRFRAGTDHGLPSPGETTLIQLPSSDFMVDSFFDITYQIEFQGCPQSVLNPYAGTTTATIRMETGFEHCEPTPDSTACEPVECPEAGGECQPRCINFDPATRYVTVLDCDCRNPDECHLNLSGAPGFNCVVPDNGTGTITLPPMGCEYTSPDEVFQIIDGLPAGTTIELDGTLRDFICCDGPLLCSACSLNLGSAECETAGGSLGGRGHCFAATLEFDATGTGTLAGFNRHLAVPVFGEVHTAPRTPGDPVQTFQTEMIRLQGELFGDPDFCVFQFRAGTVLGLPNSGETTLIQLPSGDFAVDSFFDITYQIEFAGCADSVLGRMSGTTTATIRMETGGNPAPPTCVGGCPSCMFCDETIMTNLDGTIDVCCDCVPDADLNQDGTVDFKDVAILAGQWLRTHP